MSKRMQRVELAKEMKVFDYFALGLGAMLGAAWFVLMAENIAKAGPLGAALAFLGGGFLLIPIGLSYSEMTSSIPVAGGELGFTFAAFGTKMSYACGWLLILAYAILCPWEVVAVGSLLGVVFPFFRAYPMYTVVDYVIYAPQFAVEMALAIFIIYYNYRGIKNAAKVQTWMTKFMLTCFVFFLLMGFLFGDIDNLKPLIAKPNEFGQFGGLAGFLSVLAITPFFFSGFDTIPQAAEEGKLNISYNDMGKTLTYSIIAGASFYFILIFCVSMFIPWIDMTKLPVPMAQLFSTRGGIFWNAVQQVIIWGAMAGLITTLNAFFVAATRVVFALGRAHMMPEIFGEVHPKYKTPTWGTYLVGLLTIIGPFIGKPLIAPFTNVGSLAFILAWVMVAWSAFRLRKDAPDFERPYSMPGGKAMAALAIVCGLVITGVLVVPGSPGALVWPSEFIMFGVWVLLGVTNWVIIKKRRNMLTEEERAYHMLGKDIKTRLEISKDRKNKYFKRNRLIRQ